MEDPAYPIIAEFFATKERIRDAVKSDKLNSKQKELYNDMRQWCFSNKNKLMRMIQSQETLSLRKHSHNDKSGSTGSG